MENNHFSILTAPINLDIGNYEKKGRSFYMEKYSIEFKKKVVKHFKC